MSQSALYEKLKIQSASLLEWHGTNSTVISLEGSNLSFRKNYIDYDVEISVIRNEKIIKIQSYPQVAFEGLYLYLCDVRRFEYLLDGAFYRMTKCVSDGLDVTETIALIELGYFTSDNHKHKIPLELTDKEYRSYFLKWLKLQSSLGIINQVNLKNLFG